MIGGRSYKRKSAFTLIELLVVVSIIALLMGLLIPMLSRARQQARALVCKTNLREWGFAFWFYVTDHDKIPGGLNRFWHVDLRPYYDSNDLFLCPMARKLNPIPVFPGAVWRNGTTYTAWGQFDFNLISSYGMNDHLESISPRHNKSGFMHAKWFNKDAWNIPVLMDCKNLRGNLVSNRPPPNHEDDIQWYKEPSAGEVCMDRHNGGINVLFANQTVRKVGPKELWTLKWFPAFNAHGPWTLAGGVKPEDWPQWLRKYKDY